MQDDLKLRSYRYDLPADRIAQVPATRRDGSRLMVLHSSSDRIDHLRFAQITGLFEAGDLLVVNDTRVFPARLSGTKSSGGRAEVFLLHHPLSQSGGDGQRSRTALRCEALIKSSRPPRRNSTIFFGTRLSCIVLEPRGRGVWLIELEPPGEDLNRLLEEAGDVPLPPYIKRPGGTTKNDAKRYQTVFAERPGAVAAPTAGLHFSRSLLNELRNRGVRIAPLTLHVGYGTFAPVTAEDISNHEIHREFITISDRTARLVRQTKRAGGRVWAVGTTTLRALEYSARHGGGVEPVSEWCDLYITPGYEFRVIDNLITNFHLPESSLLFLVAALCGRRRLLAAYETAIERGYRFYSYGDAMVVLK